MKQFQQLAKRYATALMETCENDIPLQEALFNELTALSDSFEKVKGAKKVFENPGITADEKFKKLKGGGANRHVYYSCSKRWEKDCKCGYIKESKLLEQLLNLIDTVKLDKTGIREKIGKEIERYQKFQSGVLGVKQNGDQKAKDVDIRNYAKYILREGEIFEKRELLSCLRSKLVFKNRTLNLET